MKQFGELERAEQVALFEAWLDGNEVEYYSDLDECWITTNTSCWDKYHAYRIKPTQPSINWDHVHPDYKWLATDKNGNAYVYEIRPYKTTYCKWDAPSPSSRVEVLVSYKAGTCNWQDSLVERPKV